MINQQPEPHKVVELLLCALVNARGRFECPVCGQVGSHYGECWLGSVLQLDGSPEAVWIEQLLSGRASNEAWRPVVGLEGRYEVSDLGRVRTVMGRIKRPYRTARGYVYFQLYNAEQRQHGRKVARLVLEAFVGPCPDGMEACHNNGVNDDDRLCNLRWDTHERNCADKIEHGTAQRGEAATNVKLTEAQVQEIREARAVGESCQSVAERYGVSKTTVWEIGRRLSWSHLEEVAAPCS